MLTIGSRDLEHVLGRGARANSRTRTQKGSSKFFGPEGPPNRKDPATIILESPLLGTATRT